MDANAISSRIKDCSKGLCSLYCPQWCYIIFPPPPPPPLKDFSDDRRSSPNFSPLFITIVGILAGALLLLSYYAILSKYCTNRFSSTRHRPRNRDDSDVELAGDEGPLAREPWFVSTNGLDEALIRSIATIKYKRGEGLVEGVECSVCLSEFVEDERLRLLPKCSHAFHVRCIDTWLKCHSNCPMCRANVAGTIPSPPQPPLLAGEAESVEVDSREEEVEETNVNAPKTPRRQQEGDREIRRSMSMDCIFELRSSTKTSEVRPSEMKRSHSGGRWFVSTWSKPNSVFPL